jgi:mannose/fructose-specific phosphotransferase system component IIA
MNENGGVRGIVVAHGAMAEGMVDAVRRIAGSAADALQAVSNEGTNPMELKALIDGAAGDGPVLVFADLQAGSCGMAAMSTCRECGERAVVCGVNLPILLDFVFHRDMPLDDLVERLLDKGRDAIRPVQRPA